MLRGIETSLLGETCVKFFQDKGYIRENSYEVSIFFKFLNNQNKKIIKSYSLHVTLESVAVRSTFGIKLLANENIVTSLLTFA